jgi:hypothetical protein
MCGPCNHYIGLRSKHSNSSQISCMDNPEMSEMPRRCRMNFAETSHVNIRQVTYHIVIGKSRLHLGRVMQRDAGLIVLCVHVL